MHYLWNDDSLLYIAKLMRVICYVIHDIYVCLVWAKWIVLWTIFKEFRVHILISTAYSNIQQTNVETCISVPPIFVCRELTKTKNNNGIALEYIVLSNVWVNEFGSLTNLCMEFGKFQQQSIYIILYFWFFSFHFFHIILVNVAILINNNK